MSDTIKVKLSKVIDMYDALQRVQAEKAKLPVKFAYALSKNLALFKIEIDALQEIQKPSPEFEKYDNERITLCREYCEKEENGNPKTTVNPVTGQGEFVIPADKKEEFTKKLTDLAETHKAAREEQLEKTNEILKMVDEEKEFTVHKVKLSSFPETMSMETISVLDSLIIED